MQVSLRFPCHGGTLKLGEKKEVRLAAGFLSAFLGIGGGTVIVPVLMVAFRTPIKRAVGTSLATVVALPLPGCSWS